MARVGPQRHKKKAYMSNLSKLVGSKLLFEEDEAHGYNDTVNIFLRTKGHN
jgi:hypothetical protein